MKFEILILFFVLIFPFVLTNVEKYIPLHRMLQYDINEKHFGCSNINMKGMISLSFSPNQSVSLTRKIFFLHLREILPFLDEKEGIKQILMRKDCVGLVILIPDNVNGFSDTQKKLVKKFENNIITKSSLQRPVYFVSQSEFETNWNEIHEKGFGIGFLNSIFGDVEYGFVNSKGKPPLKLIEITNFYGELKGRVENHEENTETETPPPEKSEKNKKKRKGKKEEEVKKSSKKSIVIHSSYDCFSVAPTMGGSGVNNCGSGFLSMLMLSKLFSRLYSNVDGIGDLDIIFLLTGGGRLRYEGSKYFVKKLVKEKNVVFVLSLEQLASEDLSLFLTKRYTDKEAVRFLRIIKRTSEELGINLKFVMQDKGNQKYEVLEHEVFQRNGLPSTTLAAANLPYTAPFLRPSLIDRDINVTLFERNVKFVANSLVNFIYSKTDNEKSMNIFSEEKFDKDFLQSWVNVTRNFHRFSAFLTKKDEILFVLKKALGKYITVQTQNFKTKTTLMFYQNSYNRLYVYNTKPFMFELLIAIMVAVYLGSILVFVMGKEKALAAIMNIFSRKKKLE